VLRLVVKGKRREMGLGSYPDVTIGEARETAALARKQLRQGVDPIEARRKMRAPDKRMTVEEAIESCFAARQADLKNDGKAGRWMSPMRVHVIPKIGSKPIEDVDQHILKSLLSPIWHTKAGTSVKALNRMSLVLKHSAALGLDVDLQAVMKTKALLGKQRHTPTNIAALLYVDAPNFYQFLCSKGTMGTLALRFLMLTCTRAGEVRFATAAEIQGDVWTIPATRTKTGKTHRVPLSNEALEVIAHARSTHDDDLIFTSARGGPLSDATMSKFMKENGYDARPHGLRATFRSWAEEQTDADWETKEMSLGHTVGGKVERAYQRSDLLEKRRILIVHWSEFISKK